MSTAHKGKIAFSDGVPLDIQTTLRAAPITSSRQATRNERNNTSGNFCLKCFIQVFFLPYLSFALILQYSILCFYGFHVSLCVTVYVFLLFILSSVLFIDLFAFLCLCFVVPGQLFLLLFFCLFFCYCFFLFFA